MLTENHCNMYYTIHFTIAIASSYATSADAVDDSLGREGEREKMGGGVNKGERKHVWRRGNGKE